MRERVERLIGRENVDAVVATYRAENPMLIPRKSISLCTVIRDT